MMSGLMLFDFDKTVSPISGETILRLKLTVQLSYLYYFVYSLILSIETGITPITIMSSIG